MTIAVMGAGNSGFGLAADLAFRGFETRLFELPEFSSAVEPLLASGGIKIRGIRGEGFGKLAMITTNPAEAMDGADLILTSIPAYGMPNMAKVMAPHLTDDHVVIIMPGLFGGALEFANVARQAGNTSSFLVAEASSFIFACKKDGPDGVWIRGLKEGLPTAAFPSNETERAMEAVAEAYPELAPAVNVLETSLSNINNPLHPTAAILNVARIEYEGNDWSFYFEGMTPAVCRLMEAVDNDRLKLVEAFGLPRMSLLDWMTKFYGHQGFGGKDLYEALSNTPVHGPSRAPTGVEHRYYSEDIPFGLVPMVLLGKQLGLDLPVIEGFVNVSNPICNRDFWTDGRSVEDLGLAGMSVDEILAYVETGNKPS